MRGRSRGVAPVVATVLLVAIVVILAGVVSITVLHFTEQVEDPTPMVSQSSGEFVGGSGDDNQIVRITHRAGDDVDVSELEIVVDAPQCTPSSARIVNLPVTGGDGFDSGNFQYGSDLIDESDPDNPAIGGTWDFGVIHEDTSNTFDAGSSFEFRITSVTASCGASGTGFDRGDVVTVSVVHAPTNAIIIQEDLVAS